MRSDHQPLLTVARRLCKDQAGNTGWIALILMTSLVSIGSIVGLTTYRNHLLQQFGDASVALRNLRQSYDFQVQIDTDRNGSMADPGDIVLSGSFTDTVDLEDLDGEAPAGLLLTVGPQNEQQ